ncbi:MAG: TPM domain-containing protein [Verrucomicrobiota bacterium]
MKCPKCQRPVDHEAESCYSCGYSELEAAAKYGANRVFLNRLHDAAACLRRHERDELNACLDRLEISYPQMLFCTYIGALPEEISISELGFWLLNHGQVKGAEYARPNENGVLLILDMNAKRVGVSLGYFAETLISEEDAYRALTHARPNLLNAEYGEALEKVFVRLAKTLRRKARRMKKSSRSEPAKRHEAPSRNDLNLPGHAIPILSGEETLEPELQSA